MRRRTRGRVERELGLSTQRAGWRVLVQVGLPVIFLKTQFLTKYDKFSKSEIGVGEVNVQHRATNETLDP